MNHSDKWIALRISLIYALVAGLWVLLSDHLLASLIPNPNQWLVAGIGKGWFFVLESMHNKGQECGKMVAP